MTETAAQPGADGVRATNRARTRTRLLDSAEELFAERGFFGVSVRDITEHAGTRLAAVSDYFGGKDNLFRDVLLRRIHPINVDRRERLATLPRSGSRPLRLRALINAFTQPMLARAGEDAGWRAYFRFTAQLANSAQQQQLLVATEYNTIAAEFVEHLGRLFPEADEAAQHDAYLFMLASTLHVFSTNLRLDSITEGRLRTDDLDQRHASLITFVEGGITRLCTG